MDNKPKNYRGVLYFAKRWNLSERTVRNYCANNKIKGAKLIGKIWYIPADAIKPERKRKRENVRNFLLDRILKEKKAKVDGGIYHKIQIELTYNSNHIEGSKLTHDETKYIYDTQTIGASKKNIDDIIETVNHFKCVDAILDNVNYKLSENFIKKLHFMLKNGTTDSRLSWFNVGDYKGLPNEVSGKATVMPSKVKNAIRKLIDEYNSKKKISLEDIVAFHYEFEMIHPFQDGNGRIGRLIMFKECLRNGIVPFIIYDRHKYYYYRGLDKWKKEKGYLMNTCLSAQDEFKKVLDYFRIKY